ncbi:MAG: sulfurtransferase TusA family protein [Treponema sp.]|jgi:TusA-related sulfurtransferase|nr:sulfurtransferase TusA family protein [Treponema sp.]
MSGSAQSQAGHAGAFVDITTVVCPVTFVKTKVALEELEDGQILEVRLNDGEPIQNVPRSLKDEGHKVTGVARSDDGTYLLTVVKGGLR